jgi:hypothetical protein
MQIGTHPERWKNLHGPIKKHEADRKARLARVKVCRLDYSGTGSPKTATFDSTKDDPAEKETAAARLAQELKSSVDQSVQLRLYVVEDLSSDVIELLGSGLDIEPSFFRAHIVDYAWYNVRDRWRDPPNLDVMSGQQWWVQVRYVTARYFKSREDFDEAAKEAERFNILRRPDDDISNNSWWDDRNAIVGLTRSRATFWLNRNRKEGEPAIGKRNCFLLIVMLTSLAVLLLDPTVDKGDPLWRGRRNWIPTPSPKKPEREWGDLKILEPKKFFDDFIYWAEQPTAFSSIGSISNTHHIPMQVLLHLVCTEWRTMSDYIKTRLCQIDLEILKPEKFAASRQVDKALDKLNMWRRFIPLYREMVSETLEQVFRFPCNTEKFSTTDTTLNGATTPHCQGESSQSSAVASQDGTQTLGGRLSPRSRSSSSHGNAKLGSIVAYRNDFLLILSYLEEYQKRIDRLTSVVTAAIQIEDSRRALGDARNIGRLTWLATFFIPFSLIATAFCMQPHVTDISDKTVKYYFAAALPLAVVTILIAWVLSHLWVQHSWARLSHSFQGKGKKEKKH